MIPRAVTPLLGLCCLLIVTLFCYGPVLFGGGQFAGGNFPSFDYPVYLRVQQEWDAGRWPLWDPSQNGGSPLLGNAVAAVLYPGKILYSLLPYDWATRLYVVAHTALAFFGLLCLARSCELSKAGSFVGALSYAFGAPVLLQYSNTMFLAGAAWIPWGLCAIDRLLRQGRRRGLIELALVLALQVLCGDPQTAYLTAACGGLYAVILAHRARHPRAVWITWQRVLAAIGIWVGATLSLGFFAWPKLSFLALNGLVITVWVAILLVIFWKWRQRPGEARLAALIGRLIAACGLAAALAFVQILPALEFASRSWRAGGVASRTAYRYSLDPIRVVELVWPSVFGIASPQNHSWLQAIPPVGSHELWLDSLYMGGAVLVLALSVAGMQGGPPWRAWLTAVLLLALAASFGKYGSPLWWARAGPIASAIGLPDPARDPSGADRFLGDGAGSPYSILAMLLPGFGAFRYPTTVVPFAAVSLAFLAGMGWDRFRDGDARVRRSLWWITAIALAASLTGLCIAWATRDRVIVALSRSPSTDALFGPVQITGAWLETRRGLAHGTIVFLAFLVLLRLAPRRPGMTTAIGLVLLTGDLAVANSRLILTVPQAEFDATSEAARRIEAAERADPSPGPFRIHRMSSFFPGWFASHSSPQRAQELIRWTRDTLYPLVALPMGLEYCSTIGSLEIDDSVAFFEPTLMAAPASAARALGLPAGQALVYYPRRSFDLWGARYFVLPVLPEWERRDRGYAAFLEKSELLYPDASVLQEPGSNKEGENNEAQTWAARQDWQLRRNLAAFPRAWVVHFAQVRPAAADKESRDRLMGSIIYMNDPIWTERDRQVLDLRSLALIETGDTESLRGFVSRTPVEPTESVEIASYEPQRVELKASLDRPGLVILADTYYPGWYLTIDGKPAPIFRANRLMRGAAVPAGQHRLVYTYQPASFRIGSFVTMSGVVVLLALAWIYRRDSFARFRPWEGGTANGAS